MEPRAIADLLNFTINSRTRQYLSNDPARLNQRIVNVVQTHVRDELRLLALEDALRSADSLARIVLERIQAEHVLAAMGVECILPGIQFWVHRAGRAGRAEGESDRAELEIGDQRLGASVAGRKH
jgi:hypothetical protein